MERKIIIGTRGSDLALWQAHHVKDRLEAAGHHCELNIITTQGDAIQHLSFDKMEGKGFFTKEIEAALLDESIDLAIHSHKDLETSSPEGLQIAAVSEREDPAEFLLIRKEVVDATQEWGLPKNAVVGTSSARRKSQLLFFRSDIQLKDLRGNVPTRIQKLRDGNYDAIMLAAAGVKRLQLDLSDLEVVRLDPKTFIPAPAQGALAIQIRTGDKAMFDAVQVLHNKEAAACIKTEREVLRLFKGGCQMPLGAYCIQNGDQHQLWVAMARQWDKPLRRVFIEGDAATLPQKAVKLLQPKTGIVFISRALDTNSAFKKLMSNSGLTCVGESVIRMEAKPFTTFPKTDWIFFSSSSAVEFFFRGLKGKVDAKMGTIGRATASALLEFGHIANFVGEGTDSTWIAEDFRGVVGSKSVLFPMAAWSKRSMQQVLSADQTHDLVVYTTYEGVEIENPEAEVLVFTSPSNVRGYLNQFPITSLQKVVAIGKTTAEELSKNNVNCILPWDASELALADVVLGLEQ